MATASAGAAASGCLSGAATGRFDESLSVFVSDLHVGGTNATFDYTRERLVRVVDEILAMRPLPRRVVCFGDVALTYGLAADYAVSKPILQWLVDAGIDLHLTAGNHDRRSDFLKCWPSLAESPLVPGRFTQVVSLGEADLILLDTLKGADDRGETDMGPVEGTLDPAQLSWFERFVAEAKRPFLVGSHHFRDLRIDGEPPIVRAAKSRHFAGWIYGHEHVWCPDLSVSSWAKNLISPTLSLPSTGLWGDIGYILFRTSSEGATAELVQSDFYFQTPVAPEARPRAWDVRLAENRNKTVTFAFNGRR